MKKSTILRSLFGSTNVHRGSKPRRMGLEPLERRELLAVVMGLAVTEPLRDRVVDAGAQNVPTALTSVFAIGGTAQAMNLSYPVSGVCDGIEFDLMADVTGPNGRPDGHFEAYVQQNVQPTGGIVTFDVSKIGNLVGTAGLHLRTQADARKDAVDQVFSLGDPLLTMVRQSGRKVTPVPVMNLGCENPEITVVGMHGTMMVSESISLPSAATAVLNQKNVVLGGFDATAKGGDLLFTQAVIGATQGNLSQFQNATLWVDADGDPEHKVDTLIQKGVSPVNGQLVFSSIVSGAYVVPNGTTTHFEYHADVVNAVVSTINSAELRGIGVEDLKTGATCDWEINHAPQPVLTIKPQGSAYLISEGTAGHQYVLAGALSDPVLHIEAGAADESCDYRTVRFQVSSELASSVSRLELSNSPGGTPFAIATQSAIAAPDGYVFFVVNTATGQWMVADGTARDFWVSVRAKDDTNGAQIGASGVVKIAADTQLPAVKVMGAKSSRTYSQNDGDTNGLEGEILIGTDFSGGPNKEICSGRLTITGSQIKEVLNANPDPDGSALPVGVNSIGQHQLITAVNSNYGSGQDVATLDTVPYLVTSINVGLDASSIHFYNKADTTTKIDCIAMTLDGQPITGMATGTFIVQARGLESSAVDTDLASGEVATFVLEANVTQPQIDAGKCSTLRVDMLLSDLSWLNKDNATRQHFMGLGLPYDTVPSTEYRA